MAEHQKFDMNDIDVHFLDARISISKSFERLKEKVEELGGASLIIIDTSAAYFEGNDENDNVEAGKHARNIRSLTKLKGSPTVLLLAHPTKNAKAENLLPRGGGAFIAEVDGNYTAIKLDNVVAFHWQGKFRGAEFDKVFFELRSVTARGLKDSKGQHIPTVIAQPISYEGRENHAHLRTQDECDLMHLVKAKPGLSYQELGEELGRPKRRVQTVMNRLRKDGLAEVENASNRARLTEHGLTSLKECTARSQLKAGRPVVPVLQ